MAVTDDQVAALRAYLSARTDAGADDAERRFLTLARTGGLDVVAVLVYGTFAAAARRKFSPTWTSDELSGCHPPFSPLKRQKNIEPGCLGTALSHAKSDALRLATRAAQWPKNARICRCE
jgi:hypothetical protein